MESQFASICRYLILLLCVSLVVSPYHATAKTTGSHHKRLKFYMKPRHRQVPRQVNDIRGEVTPNARSIGMLVNISIGNPPVPQLLVMDTGSEIMWLQCASCSKCFKQTNPLYDPTKSSTYRSIKCNDLQCPTKECSSFNNCIYRVLYGDGTNSNGTVGIEQMTFKTSDDGIATVDGVMFGCGIDNVLVPADGGESGVLGLNAGLTSLTHNNGHKFSYCIGNLDDHSYPYNQLIVGEGAKMEGSATPLEVYNGHYYVTLDSISIGEATLDIDARIFQRSISGKGGVIVDSGTTEIFLDRVAYDVVKEKVSNLVGSLLSRRQHPELLCYWGDVSKVVGFPTVTFHFAGGAELGLEPKSVFEQWGQSTICLAMRPNGVGDVTSPNIIGLMAQQNYNVGFDPDGGKLYLSFVDCQLMED